MNRIDLSGQKFGRLTVLGLSHVKDWHSTDRHSYWLCLCDCGEEKLVRYNSLTQGESKSCGCLQRELASVRLSNRLTTHRMTGSPEYKSGIDMISRCTNPKDTGYKDYGARGIRVCDL